MAANTQSLSLVSSSTQFASVTDTAALSLTGDMSAFAWVKLTSDTGDGQTIVSKFFGATNNRSYFFTVSPTTLSFFNSSTGANLGSCSVSATISTGTYFHVGFTKSGSTVKFYVNAVQSGANQTAGFSTTFDSTASFAIGASEVQGVTEKYFNGLIDEVVVTSDAMSTTEISNLFAGWDATKKVANIVGYWKLNNDYTDSSGNGQTLTASGSPTFSTTVPFSTYAGDTGAAFLMHFV